MYYIFIDRKNNRVIAPSIASLDNTVSNSSTCKHTHTQMECLQAAHWIFTGSFVFYCIVLCCAVLYCIALYCTTMYLIALYCLVLQYIVLNGIVLYCIVLYCIVLYCIVLYCIVYCTSIHMHKSV